jgi:hypothetical protein
MEVAVHGNCMYWPVGCLHKFTVRKGDIVNDHIQNCPFKLKYEQESAQMKQRLQNFVNRVNTEGIDTVISKILEFDQEEKQKKLFQLTKKVKRIIEKSHHHYFY